MANKAQSLIGRKVRCLEVNSDGSKIRWTGAIVREGDDFVTVRVPDRVRQLPFPPCGVQPDGLGPKYVKYRRAGIEKSLVE